jgi:hypothetical protein
MFVCNWLIFVDRCIEDTMLRATTCVSVASGAITALSATTTVTGSIINRHQACSNANNGVPTSSASSSTMSPRHSSTSIITMTSSPSPRSITMNGTRSVTRSPTTTTTTAMSIGSVRPMSTPPNSPASPFVMMSPSYHTHYHHQQQRGITTLSSSSMLLAVPPLSLSAAPIAALRLACSPPQTEMVSSPSPSLPLSSLSPPQRRSTGFSVHRQHRSFTTSTGQSSGSMGVVACPAFCSSPSLTTLVANVNDDTSSSIARPSRKRARAAPSMVSSSSNSNGMMDDNGA